MWDMWDMGTRGNMLDMGTQRCGTLGNGNREGQGHEEHEDMGTCCDTGMLEVGHRDMGMWDMEHGRIGTLGRGGMGT